MIIRFWKEKKHIGFKKLFRLITRNISPLWEGRTVSFRLQRLAFTKSCRLNFSSSGSSCSGSTSNRRTDTCNTDYNDLPSPRGLCTSTCTCIDPPATGGAAACATACAAAGAVTGAVAGAAVGAVAVADAVAKKQKR